MVTCIHPLMDQILRCINNNPRHRAHASDIVEREAAMILHCPTSFANRLEMLRHIEHQEREKLAYTEEKLALREERVREL